MKVMAGRPLLLGNRDLGLLASLLVTTRGCVENPPCWVWVFIRRDQHAVHAVTRGTVPTSTVISTHATDETAGIGAYLTRT